MSGNITIVGFTSSVRTPGFYGETVYGAGPISAASIPLKLLYVGTKLSAGSATADQDINLIQSFDDADAFFGAGSELARLCYAGLSVPGGPTIYAAAVAEAGGAVAAALTFTIGGSWSTAGTLTVRINGESMSLTVGASDTTSNVATNLAALLNQSTRRPYTSSPSSAVVTTTINSKGARGNQYIAFKDTTKAPAGLTCTLGGGGSSVTGGGLTFASGAGTDSAANLITVLANQTFDRICTAENDATNLGRWKTALNTAAGPTVNILEHMLAALNGSNAASITLANTVNFERLQLMQYLNGETAPWEMAAEFAARRVIAEQSDPCASYDDVVLTQTAPQSQPADRPSPATLTSLINNGVTPVYTPNGNQALVCRSVTTHTLNGSTPDYRTLDTSQAYVPDFVRKDLQLLWLTDFKPNNPRVMDDPPSDAKELPSGIATPKTWTAAVTLRLRNFEKGILASGSAPTTQQVPPIIINVDGNLPTFSYSPTQACIIGAVPVVPAPIQHQIGVSVRNVTAA